jgi:hypothetical protein
LVFQDSLGPILNSIKKIGDEDLQKYVPSATYVPSSTRYEQAWDYKNTKEEKTSDGHGDIAIERFMEALFNLYYKDCEDFKAFEPGDRTEIQNLSNSKGSGGYADTLMQDFVNHKKTQQTSSQSATTSSQTIKVYTDRENDWRKVIDNHNDKSPQFCLTVLYATLKQIRKLSPNLIRVELEAFATHQGMVAEDFKEWAQEKKLITETTKP